MIYNNFNMGVFMKATQPSVKDIAEEYANCIWNTKDMSALDRFVDQHVVIHSLLGNLEGMQAIKNVIQTWLKGFPDLHVTNNLVIAENDLVSIQWEAHGTHKGEFQGKQPRGKKVSYSGVTVYRIKNGKINEYWAYLDMQHLLNQL